MDTVRRDRSFLIPLAVETATARKLLEQPEFVLSIARRQLPVIRSTVRGMAVEWVDEWSRLLDGPLSELAAAMTREDQHGANMRSVAPFAGSLTREERRAALISAIPTMADSANALSSETLSKLESL